MKKTALYSFVFMLLSLNLLIGQNKVEIIHKAKDNGVYEFYAVNLNIIPYYIKVEFSVLDNLKSDTKLPFAGVINENTKERLIFTLTPADVNKGYSFNMSYSYIPGDPINTRHNDSYLYTLPYEHGTKHKIVQGYNGQATHKGVQSFAVDFDFDSGTKVAASREGLVVEIKEDSDIGGGGEQFAKYGNFVKIYHDDGTFADYVHLQKNGALVNVGDRVKAGQIIGLSGNTGYSAGPHLHFSVSIPDIKGSLQTIPVKFFNYDKTAVVLEEGEFYYSTHQGMSEYAVISDKNIKDADYEKYFVKISNNDKVEIRTEEIDNTIIVYVRNGYNKKVDFTLTLSMANLSSNRGGSIKILLEPLTERYACILRLIDKKDGYNYNFKMQYIFISP